MGNDKINLTYEIRLNDEGRPYIHLPDEYESEPEHLFLAYELVRYSLFDLLERNEVKQDLKEESAIKIGEAGHTISQISDEFAQILKGRMNALDDLDIDLPKDE